jgi:hypothetical protein
MKSFLKQHSIVSFFLMTYAISWVIWIPALLIWKRHFAPDRFPWWFFGSYVVGSYGPTFAALIMAGILQGRSGIKALLKKYLIWRVDFRWYLVAFLLPALGTGIAMGIYVLQGGILGRFDLSQWYLIFLVQLLAIPSGAVGE